jgi:general secretion pathway protein K
MTPLRHSRQRGIALLIVLWIFMILGVLALDFARYVRDDAMAAVNFADETRGYYLALAGMNRAIFDAEHAHERSAAGQANDTPNATGKHGGAPGDDEDTEGIPPDGQWHEQAFAGGRYAVRMTDEGGRISLNKADEETLTRVLTNLVRGGNATTGVNKRTADDIAVIVDSILDWRDPDDLKRLHGAESDYYLGLRTPYRAKNGFFDSPEELLLVQGVSAAVFYGGNGLPGLRDVFSVYNRSPTVNARTASPAVLQALLGIDTAAATDLAGQRDNDASSFLPQLQAQLSAVDPHLRDVLVNEPPTVLMLEARGDMQDPRNQSRVAAVVDIASNTSEGAKIVRWLDRAPWEGAIPAGEPGEDGGAAS